MGSLFLELSKQESLLKLMEERGFTLCQQNGQRTYGGPPPGWGTKPPPNRDCEVFIGRLPRMCFEDELIPLFASMGELYEFRLMLDFSGTNRGYAYAHYTTPEGALRAIKCLNKYEIRPGHLIGVLKSKNNCRLLFGNIKSGVQIKNFSDFICNATEQVLNVIMFEKFSELKSTDYRISSEVEEAFLGRVLKNEGKFAIVEYENHKAAAVARRVLIPKYGHILAIDWAVPPRDRKRIISSNESTTSNGSQTNSINQMIFDSNILSPMRVSTKIRPVPELIIEPSIMDDVPFMHKSFFSIVKYFKYQICLCLYISTDRLEIPLFICKEIERKIVNRVTNLKNCSEAIQLIFNYFSWYNEKKNFVIDYEVQSLLQEVKLYSDVFVQYVMKRFQMPQNQVLPEEEYYSYTLPLNLSILFRIILRASTERQLKLSGITKGLNWLSGIMKSNELRLKYFIEEVITQMAKEQPSAVDKSCALAKSMFLNAITSNSQTQNSYGHSREDIHQQILNFKMDEKNFQSNGLEVKNPILSSSNMELKNNTAEIDFQPNPATSQLDNSIKILPPVPLLIIKPSIMNNPSCMSRVFFCVITFFKHMLRICANTYIWQMNIPQPIYREIEIKIIDRISNMENCSEAVQLIINYFSWWIERRPGKSSKEIHVILSEIKLYANSFVQFIWNKTLNSNVEIINSDNYYSNALPLKLSLLHQISLIYNSGQPYRYVVFITKGLAWLDDIIEKGNKESKMLISELSRFILELNSESYDWVKLKGKLIIHEIINPDILFDVQKNGEYNNSISNQIKSIYFNDADILDGKNLND